MVKYSAACLFLSAQAYAFAPTQLPSKRAFLLKSAEHDFYDQVTSEGASMVGKRRATTAVMPQSSEVTNGVKFVSAVMDETEVEGATAEDETEVSEDGEESMEEESSATTASDKAFSYKPEDAEIAARKLAKDMRKEENKIARQKVKAEKAARRAENGMSLPEFTAEILVPAAVVGFLGNWVYKNSKFLYDKGQADTLASYANEMIYHDGDFEEMKMCQNEYRRKLGIGPKRRKMLTSYLEQYAKKKVVSPQAISSLSYVFSLYNLSEKDAAKVIVKAAENLSTQPASRSKLLFFGEHILKSPEGLTELQPIRDMLASSYRSGGPAIVANAQKTIGQAAYKNAVIAAGDEQTSLTVGWELLGLTKDEAETVYESVKSDGFQSDAKKLYGGPKQEFDEKGRRIDSKGKLMDKKDEDSASDGPKGSIFECGNCGYTLFPAKGREFKFFPDDFKCPECGSPKDQFIGRD